MRIAKVVVSEERGECSVHLDNGERLENVTGVVSSANTEGLPTGTITVLLVYTGTHKRCSGCGDAEPCDNC